VGKSRGAAIREMRLRRLPDIPGRAIAAPFVDADVRFVFFGNGAISEQLMHAAAALIAQSIDQARRDGDDVVGLARQLGEALHDLDLPADELRAFASR